MSSFRWVPWKSRAEREWLNDSSFHGMTSFESSFAGWSRPQVWWLSNKCTLIDLSIFCCSFFALSVCANSILHPEECTALWQQQWYQWYWFVIVFCAHLTMESMEMPGGWRTTFHTIQKRRASEVPRTTQRQVQRGSRGFHKWRKRNGLQISRPAVCQVSQMSRQHQLGILAVNSIAGSGSPDCTPGNSESYSNSFSRPLLPLHVDEVLQSWMTIITSILEALDFLCVVTLECSCCNTQRTDLAGPKVAEADPVSHQPPETIAGTIVEFSQTSFGCHFKQTRLPLR